MRILVVDDNDDVAAVFTTILEDEGYEVHRSATAFEAIERALDNYYDLIIMDLLLQDTNGVVASLALRGMSVDSPIVIVTGGLMSVDTRLYSRANFAGQLLKPVLPTELKNEVAKHIQWNRERLDSKQGEK